MSTQLADELKRYADAEAKALAVINAILDAHFREVTDAE